MERVSCFDNYKIENFDFDESDESSNTVSSEYDDDDPVFICDKNIKQLKRKLEVIQTKCERCEFGGYNVEKEICETCGWSETRCQAIVQKTRKKRGTSKNEKPEIIEQRLCNKELVKYKKTNIAICPDHHCLFCSNGEKKKLSINGLCRECEDYATENFKGY